MIATIKSFKHELLLCFLVITFPLYVTIFITPDWTWLLFSLFFAAAYLFFVTPIKRNLKIFVLLFAMLPFLFFDALLLVNYFIQGTGFNEAFYFHFNKHGIVGYQNKILILVIIMLAYYLYLCFLTFKLHRGKSNKKSDLFAGSFIILLALMSPQSLSFGKMYMEAHNIQLLSQYFPSSNSYDESLINQLVKDANNDFKYRLGDKKNLVFIYAESLEANFFDNWIVQGRLNALNEMKESSIVFSNMMETTYTGWTVAGMVASLCGLPLQMPLTSSSNNFSLTSNFMPNAECLSDILKKEDYYLSFLGGANLNFAGKKAFLKTHSFDNIFGKNRFKAIHPENEHNYNQWGLRDRPLFEYALDDYLDLASKQNPFALFLLTLDTHAPGFPDPACTNRYLSIQDNRMLDAVLCSSQLIKKYIIDIRNSPYSNNTVIVVMSDHLAHKNPADYLLKQSQRKLMFMINMPSGNNLDVKNSGTHYDIGPTVLSAIGFDNCQAFGFGHNMLPCGSKENSASSKEGLLYELFSSDKNVKNVVTNTKVKSFVRTKWGDFLGGIDSGGIDINDTNYTITIGNKQYSYRHPQPFRNSQSGALLIKLAKNTYDIKNITSMKDYIRLPDQFSIEHWLSNKDGIYLYIGNKSSLSSLNSMHNDEENIIAFINQDQNSVSIVPIKNQLKISLDDIRRYINDGQLAFPEKIEGLSFLSCLDKVCQSHVETAFGAAYVLPIGLSIGQISDTGEVKALAHIDHCENQESFNEAPSLTSLVNSAKESGQDSIVLIGNNSVFCKSRQDMIRWIKPFSLSKLEHINDEQPYIGIINLKNNNITEFVSEDYIQIKL
ncbi:MAG: sulfatase-like hydrolase/transferase [Methylococcaceae bacterium]